MKTYLALISAAVLAALSVVSAVEPLHKYPEFLRNAEIKIPNDYTPFGNRMQYNRFGDDGSSCVLDSSGVLTWIDSQGTVRVLPDTLLAVPLFVTNTECLVWNNSLVDYDGYPNRPKAEIKFFRANVGSSTVTSTAVNTEGVEVAPTAPITTATGSLNFVTLTRKDNGNEVGAGSTLRNIYDSCDIRVYRMTYDGSVQLLKALPLYIKGGKDYNVDTTSGPGHAVLGYGSDGSMLLRVNEVQLTDEFAIPLGQAYDQFYWINSSGKHELINRVYPDTTPDAETLTVEPIFSIDRCLFISSTRLVYENPEVVLAPVPLQNQFSELNRGVSSGNLTSTTPKLLKQLDGTPIAGNSMDAPSYTKVGFNRYFYTVDLTNANLVRTYQLATAGVYNNPLNHTLSDSVSTATVIGGINPNDGSALLYAEDSQQVAWLHAGINGAPNGPGVNVSELPDSSQGAPIFVTNEQVVVWNNAKAPVGDDGKIPPVVLRHYSRDLDTGVLTPTDMPVQGTTVLNSSPYTPSFPYWLVTTAEKTKPDTAFTRTYRLDTVFISDRDGDGLLDIYETNTGVYVSPTDTGSDPRSPDSDDDGLSDYDEVYVYVTDPNNADSDGDGVGDSDEVDTYLTDPTQVDTDLDGISDYDEIFVLHTDPTMKSFGETPDPTDNVDFASTSVNGDYEGLVYDPVSGFSFKQTLRLSSTGAFTGNLKGLLSDSSYRGQFLDTGLYVGPVTAQGVTSVQMVVAPNSSGNYIVSGSYQTVSGGTAYFELKRSLYSKTNRYTGPSKVTFEAMLALAASGPQGSAVGTGTISTSGLVSFSLYMPDGGKQSFSGPILEGETIALFSKGARGNKPVLLGSLKIMDMPGESDFNGSVRLFGGNSSSNSMFPTGYDQDRQLLGAYYYPPAKGTMPLNSFLPTSNNIVFRWLSGNFAGVTKVGTWATNASVQVPKTQFDSAKVSFKASTGLMSISYTRTDANLELFKSNSTGHAVVQQKSGTVNGYYVSARSAGSFGVTANSGNLQPEIASISPKSKTMAAAGGSYAVTVTAVGAWRVELPSTVNWVSVTTTSQTGAGVFTGSGNGTVIVTVRASSSMTRDEVELKIAGIGHTITREFR